MSERKARFLVGWVERNHYVGFRTSIQPTNIKQLPKYGFSERNPTNHVAGVFVQALAMYSKKNNPEPLKR